MKKILKEVKFVIECAWPLVLLSAVTIFPTLYLLISIKNR